MAPATARPRWRRSTGWPVRNGTSSSRIACRPDLRQRRNQKRGRQAARTRLQAGPDRAAPTGRSLWQLAVAQSFGQEALDVFEAFDKVLPRHPLIVEEMNKLKAGVKLPPLVSEAQAGGAEALYGLGASLGRRGGEDLGLVYLQLSLHLAPSHPLALLSLADLYELLKKPEMAIKVYERIPAQSALYRNASIQMAADLDALDRSDEAQKRLDAIIKADPKDLEAILALGNLQRGHKKFAECGDTYTKALDLIGTPDKSNWTVFYFRGICFERAKQWPKAEADLKKALELVPDQPQVLNYLGYSWIDQGVNLDEGMTMIKRRCSSGPTTATSSIRSAGPITGSAITRGSEEPRARDRAQAGRSDHQRPSRRRLLAGRARARSQLPVGACARSQARSGRSAEDRGKAEERAAGRDLVAGQGRQEGRQRRLRLDGAPCGSKRPSAKINLTLRVLGRRADGYHELESLVVFADVADTLTLEPGGAQRSTSPDRLPMSAAPPTI